jgi:hypothetical protein
MTWKILLEVSMVMFRQFHRVTLRHREQHTLDTSILLGYQLEVSLNLVMHANRETMIVRGEDDAGLGLWARDRLTHPPDTFLRSNHSVSG